MIDEKPILFSAPMVRAILEGRKTATMRPVKLEYHPSGNPWGAPFFSGVDSNYVFTAGFGLAIRQQRVVPPYQVGDLLWIREAWRAWHGLDDEKPGDIYQKDGINKSVGLDIWYEADGLALDRFGKLRPGIFLPKRFARPARLEVRGVGVARPRLLTATQIEAEGVDPVMVDRMGLQAAWQDLWENSYGHKSWQQNPWCFRYTFRLARP